MNSVEEKLWNYIDGLCTPEEQKAISLLIQQDEVYRKKYKELSQLNQEFASVSLDEPSMAFTYNVMEAIRTQNAAKPLKAQINSRIVWVIAGFFIVTLAALLVYAFSTVNWASGQSYKLPQQLNVQVTQVNTFFTGPAVKAFLFFDIVAGLFLLDHYLRRKMVIKEQ